MEQAPERVVLVAVDDPRLEAAYGTFGEPQLVGLDPIPNAIDDELTIETAEFTPSP